jgi:hypothetical protein
MTIKEWQALGFDKHLKMGDPMFIDSENRDYRVNA